MNGWIQNLINKIKILNNDVKVIEHLTSVLTLAPTVPTVTISHGEETHVDVNLSPSTVISSPTIEDPINELEDVDISSTGLVMIKKTRILTQ